jgi:hypothetical protein
MTDDNGKGLRALFYGLCAIWDMEVLDMQEADAMPSDFCLMNPPCCVVIVPEPGGRQVEIAALRHRGVPLIILDREDLDSLRRSVSRASAWFVLDRWLRLPTHASAERRLMGLDS